MIIYFPQWQGSGKGKDIMHGAKAIRDALKNDMEIIELFLEDESAQKNDINHHDAIVEQLRSYKRLLEDIKPAKVNTIGGDCGLEIVPVSYLNTTYENFGVIWFDAHADINSPKESPSKNFHGMPLRTLLGEVDDEALDTLLFSKISDSQIHYIGLRDIDDAEQERLSQGNIFAPLTIDVDVLYRRLQNNGIKNLYLHFDVDCLKPSQYPSTYYQVENGLDIAEAKNLIASLSNDFNIVGTSILESTATTMKELKPIKEILNLLFKN